MEDLCQHILKKTSVVSPAEAQEMIISTIQALVLVEKCLKNIHEADLKVQKHLVLSQEELYSLTKGIVTRGISHV